jgi:hypothetical protein
VKELSQNWALQSSLHEVVFESAWSLRKMVQIDKVYLMEGLEIQFVECECALDFPGYCVETVRGGKGAIRLRKLK